MSHTPSPHPPPPPSPPASQSTNSVRRHHTISAASRAAHASARNIANVADEQYWAEDEPVAPGWDGGAGAVGAVGVHRQSSLPSKYSRAFRANQGRGPGSGSVTPSRTVNSLSAITAEHGAEGEGEEDWEKDLKTWNSEDHENNPAVSPPQMSSIGATSLSRSHSQSSRSSITPLYSPPMHPNSPPPGQVGSNIRRHQSMKDRASNHSAGANLVRAATHGKRHGPRSHLHGTASPPVPGDSVENQNENPPSPVARNPWGNENDSQGASDHWPAARPADETIEEVQRALAGVNLSGPTEQQHYYQPHQPTPLRINAHVQQPSQAQQNKLTAPTQPPRFKSPRLPSPGPNQSQQPQLTPTYPGNSPAGSAGSRSPHKLQLITDLTNQGQGYSGSNKQGPLSASAYVPPIGHGLPGAPGAAQRVAAENSGAKMGNGAQPQRGNLNRDKPLTASGVVWDQKERIVGGRADGQGEWDGNNGIPPVPPLNAQNFGGFNRGAALGFMVPPQDMAMNYLGMSQPSGQGMPLQGGMARPTVDVNSLLTGGANGAAGAGMQGQAGNGAGQMGSQGNFLSSPVDIPSLIASKGYNPANFDIRPAYARYFVIKSYTEDDVHKSLKYEIWSSTDPGNKRLDKAFRESSARGPIYLFFSVNASGHFCGMAEMLTPVDYTRSSTVWAQDKWKGVFKVRWIFIRDVPNASLRHIRLNNTQERKPVTNSRDTQELLPEAGQEMLRIFFTHPSRTSLLQDFAFYELQSMQKGLGSPPQQHSSPQQHPYAMLNTGAMAQLTQQQQMLMQMHGQFGQIQGMPNMGSGSVSPPRQNQSFNTGPGGMGAVGGFQ